MNYDLLTEWVRQAGANIDAQTLERAEAAARPVLSRFLSSGGSTEAKTTLEVYARAMLQAAAESAGSFQYQEVLPKLLPVLEDPENWSDLWLQAFPGVGAALDRARKAGIRLAVVSNSDGRIHERLTAAGLGDKFDAVVDSGSVGYEKPDPRIFEYALQEASATPERTCHIGDLYSVDVLGARRAGIWPILLDPFDDWQVDCPKTPSTVALIEEWCHRKKVS